jgi:hypothetical protein
LNPFDYLPLTFHIQNGSSDPEYVLFKDVYYHLKAESEILNVYIIIIIIRNAAAAFGSSSQERTQIEASTYNYAPNSQIYKLSSMQRSTIPMARESPILVIYNNL